MKKTDKKEQTSDKLVRRIGTIILPYFIICITFFMVKDFIVNLTTDKNSYELKHEEIIETDADGKEIDYGNGQKIYRLYRNGEYFADVDVNEFTMCDENGNTDLRYCALIHDARKVTYTAIFAAMAVLMILITSSIIEGTTPFTKANARRIKAIGILQLSLAIVPGLVVLIMKMVRFDYIHAELEIESLYMFIIAFVIMVIGMVFDYGVKLQQDNDLIA